MRIFNNYILSLAVITCSIDVVLGFWGQQDLEVYFTINIIAFLIITLLYVYLNPKARKALNAIGFVLFGGFMVIVALKVMDIIAGK